MNLALPFCLPDMNVHPDLPDHPKFIAYKQALGRTDALDYLIRIWGYCQTRRTGENWGDVDETYVEAVAGWRGKPGSLFRALTAPWCGKKGWIHRDGKNLIITGWEEHNRKLLAAWRNGPNGRKGNKNPPATEPEPNEKPSVPDGLTDSEPTANRPRVTGLDVTGCDVRGSTPAPFAFADSESGKCPPTLDAVIAYGKKMADPAKKIPAMAEEACQRFFRHWASKGWLIAPRVLMQDFRPRLEMWHDEDLVAGKNAPGVADLAQLQAELDSASTPEQRQLLRDKIANARRERSAA